MNKETRKKEYRKLATRLLLGTYLTMGITGCNQKNPYDDLQPITYNILLEDTLENKVDNQQEETELLKTMLEKYQLVENMDLKVESTLSDTEKEYLDNLTTEEISILMNTDSNNKGTYLSYIKESSRNYIQENGLTISMSALKQSLKKDICEAINLDMEEDKITVMNEENKDPYSLTILFNDSIATSKFYCNLETTSYPAKILNKISVLEELKNPTFEEIKNNTKEVLDLVEENSYYDMILQDGIISSEFNPNKAVKIEVVKTK